MLIIETNPIDANLAAALGYARRGWRVFPCHAPVKPRRVGFGSAAIICCSCGRSKCEAIGKHPATRHGCKDATRDERIIREWWQARPDANIGIATGDGLVVIDVDKRNGGDKTLTKLERKHGKIPDGAKAISGSGGPHYYLRLPKGVAIASSSAGLGEGIDIKAESGYVVAAPSVHKSGRRYRWANGKMPPKLPSAPASLVKLMLDGSTKIKKNAGSAGGDWPAMKTADHPVGQAYAKLLNARDCGTYWRFDCPAREHKTPQAALYPREGGRVYLKCWSSNPCSTEEIAAAIEEMLEREAN